MPGPQEPGEGDAARGAGRAVQVDTLKRVEASVDSAWLVSAPLDGGGYDEPLSNFAFNLNLRRYVLVDFRCHAPGRFVGTALPPG